SKEFKTLNERHYAYQRKLDKLNALTSQNLVTACRNLAFVLFLVYFGLVSLDRNSLSSIGMVYTIVDYITRLFEPGNDIVNQLPLIEQARVAGNRVFTLMYHDGEEVKNESIPRYRGHVQFDDVSFAYNDTDYVLKHISFAVKPGETAAF